MEQARAKAKAKAKAIVAARVVARAVARATARAGAGNNESELSDLQSSDVELRAPLSRRQYRQYHQRCNYGLREHGKCQQGIGVEVLNSFE